MGSQTRYTSQPMVRALLIAIAHGKLYPNRGENLILGAWGEDWIQVRDATGIVVQEGYAYKLANAPVSTIPPNTFDALLRRKFISPNGEITETGKSFIVSLVKHVSA